MGECQLCKLDVAGSSPVVSMLAGQEHRPKGCKQGLESFLRKLMFWSCNPQGRCLSLSVLELFQL